MQSSDIVSFNIWQVIISLLNLLILFLILKKFLYKPVKKVLEERQSMLDEHFSNAENAEKSAKKAQKTYEEKLAGANTEAAEILKMSYSNSKIVMKNALAELKEFLA